MFQSIQQCICCCNFHNGSHTSRYPDSFRAKPCQLTSRQFVTFYLHEIEKPNPILKWLIEVNHDALYLADKADQERQAKKPGSCNGLHGVPMLLKDNIGNTTAGSFALLGFLVPQDAGVVKKLRKAGAIVLGKASLSEWANCAAFSDCLNQVVTKNPSHELTKPFTLFLHLQNPYVLSADPCGSSSRQRISDTE